MQSMKMAGLFCSLMALCHCGGSLTAESEELEDPDAASADLDAAKDAAAASPADVASPVDQGKPDTRRADARDATKDSPAAPSASDAFFGAPRCAPDLLFCEDFESGTLDPARWGKWTGDFRVE